MVQHFQEFCGVSSIKNSLILLYENNIACATQSKETRIKIIGLSTFHLNYFLCKSNDKIMRSIPKRYDQMTI